MSPIISIWVFSRRSRAANSEVWPNFELIRDFIVVHVTCKNEEDPIKMKLLKGYNVFYILMGAICCHGNQTSDPIWPKTYCSLFPDPMMLQIKKLLRLVHWSQRYSCLKVWMHGRRLESHPISLPCEPSAQVS